MEKSLFMQERRVHPLTKVSLEERVSYLKAIAVFVALEDANRKKFTRLIKLLECEDVREDLFNFLETITEEQQIEIYDSLKERVRLQLSIDIIYNFNVKIIKTSDLFVNDLLLVSRPILSLLQKLILAIKVGKKNKINKAYLELLNFNGLYEAVGEFANIYGFEYEHSLEAIANDFIFAGKNRHEKRYQPQYMDTKILSENKNIMLPLISKNANVLEYVDERLNKDKGFALIAVQNNGLALQYLINSWTTTLRKDRSIVMAAVKNNGMALQYADYSLQRDKYVVINAIKQNKEAIKYADDSLQEDKDIQLALKA